MRFLAAMGKCECIDALNDQSFAFTGLCDCSRFAKLAGAFFDKQPAT